MKLARAVATAAACALLGALAGRIAAAAREQAAAGEPLRLQPAQVTVHGRDLVPGMIAALRVNDRPWSYLGVPAWLAAFVVNFSLIALSRELEPVIGLLRGGLRELGPDARPSGGVWTVEAVPSAVEPPGDAGAFHPFAD
jgi:hypothetical protein